jgi:hypothetical protein
MITTGQNARINALTEKALAAFDRLVEAQLTDPARLENPNEVVNARARYYWALDNLGNAITDAVGLPYELRIRSIEKQRQRQRRSA